MMASCIRYLGRRSRRTFVAAVITSCGVNLACSNVAGNGALRAQTAGQVRNSRSTDSRGAHPTAAPSRPAGLPSNDGADSAPGAAQRAGEQVHLPVDQESLRRELPSSFVDNYAGWAQAARIDVGFGYLDTLEPVNQDQWMLVQSDEQPTVFVYDNHSHRAIAKWPVAAAGFEERRTLLAWPDRPGREPCFLSAGANGAVLYNAVTGRVMKQLTSEPVGQAQWSKDRTVLMTVHSSIDTQTSELSFHRRSSDLELVLVATLPTTERVDAWALSRDNRFLARGFYPSGSVTIVDLQSGAERLRMNAPGHASSIEFSPDERFLAVGGEGVVVVDLDQPARRAEYSYFYNNVAEVEYSPSGDILAVATYDGRVRLLKYSTKVNGLELVHTLRHDRQTNVYALQFIDSGATLVSSSGDRSVRYWSSPRAKPKADQERPQWRSVGERISSNQTSVASTALAPTASVGPHYVPARLNAAPIPSRIAPGKYACKISNVYKLRDCSVEQDTQGHTLLEFSKDNLLGIRGVLYDDGPVVRFEGWLTEGGALGCAGCEYEPIHGVFKGKANSWEGVLLYRKHFDPFVPHDSPPPDVAIDEAIDRYPVVLKRR